MVLPILTVAAHILRIMSDTRATSSGCGEKESGGSSAMTSLGRALKITDTIQ